jgi:hypothetical protein
VRRVLLVPTVAIALVCAQTAPAAAPTRVTIVGDSVAAELNVDPQARSLLSRGGLDVDLELTACRRLAKPSCTVAGVQPPTLLQLIADRGRGLGPAAVVAVGYNDNDTGFTQTVDAVLDAFARAGVRRVVWLTYRAARHDLLHMNAELRAVALRRPQLAILDWNRYSRSHPSWFAADGVHLTPAGAEALAAFLRTQLPHLLG